MVAVRAHELSPHIIKAQAVLRTAALGAERERARIERKIFSAHIHCGRRQHHCRHRHAVALTPLAGEGRIQPAHLATAAAAGSMNAVVERPVERVHHRLDVQLVRRVWRVVAGKAAEDHFAHVGDAIAVRILEIENVRRGTDEHAAVPADDRSRPRHVLREDGALVETPVAIAVLQQSHAPELFGTALRIVAHLDDVEPPVLVEAHGHRAHDERF